MSEPVTCIQKPEPATHTPGPWRTESSYGRKTYDSPLMYCGEWIRAGNEFVASTWSTGDEATQRLNASLIVQAPALLAHAEKSLCWLIGERDCYYEGCSVRDSGEVVDENDREILASLDRDIDELRALISAAKGAV